ncbi:MAG: class I SAM-dependent RNA methyltransferase, partial [Bacteroidetes bacterium]|nr:class I SAM-dependent RNA methyltransferase [Bacteroidota bacterium]
MKDIQTLKKGEELTLNIESMSFGGQGVGRHDEFVVFVDGAIPGDTARVLITKKKKNFAEARNLKILSPSPHRIKPVCPYFGVCGGCRMQDVEYETQLEFKRRNVADVFERLGTFEGLAIPKPIGSPDIFHYRNKMEFSFG